MAAPIMMCEVSCQNPREVAPSVRQTLTDKESATLVREAVAFQAAAERLKHEVYNSA